MTQLPTRRAGFFPELRQLRNEIDRIFDGFGTSLLGGETETGWVPAMDLSETPDELVARVELPGMNRDDVEIEIQNNVLTVRGEKQEEREQKEEKHYLYERSYGSFVRSFNLPRSVDSERVRARFENGILTIHMPKTEEARGRRIQIESGT